MSEFKYKKSLVIYFSRAGENYAVGYINKGNTQYIAEYINEIIGAPLFKVEPLVPYSDNYNTCLNEAKQRVGKAPVKEYLKDISIYEVIYILTPIYWGSYAPEMETVLKELDFKDKTIRIITTHEGSGLANVVSDIKKVCKGANVVNDALAIRGMDCKNARNRVEKWL